MLIEMKIDLDQPKQLAVRDSGGMLERLGRFPESCVEAIGAVEKASLDLLSIRELRTIIVAGIGGSAIGGLLLRDWLREDCPIQIHVSRGYHLPRFVDEDALIFAVSYSGNTEETLNQFKEALARRCQIISLTSGGALEEASTDNRVSVLRLPRGVVPRAALPSQFFSLATAMKKLGLVSELWGQVEEALHILESLRKELMPETPTALNPAKQLALGLCGMVPFIYGPRMFEAVAYRISTQLNENSKVFSSSAFFPEAFHNAVMGVEGPEEVRRKICAIVINDPNETPEMKRKIMAFKQLLRPAIGQVLEITARGTGKLARILSPLYVGDFASTYFGLHHGLDPSSMSSIEALKRL